MNGACNIRQETQNPKASALVTISDNLDLPRLGISHLIQPEAGSFDKRPCVVPIVGPSKVVSEGWDSPSLINILKFGHGEPSVPEWALFA